MPFPGTVNNPGGANSWTGFATEQPYGEITNQKRLAQGAPLAGGKVSAGPMNAALRAGKQAKKPPKTPAAGGTLLPPTPPPGGIIGPTTGVPPWADVYPPGTIQNMKPASLWQTILGVPGASRHPILSYYAGAL